MRHMTATKKGQMEILGLAIIILLVSVGILLIVKFVVLKPSENTKASYVYAQMASNIINAMLKTNTQCRNQDITELWQDCISYNSFCENGMSSCEYAADAMNTMLGRTVANWSRSYVMQATLGGELKYANASGLCTRNMEKQSKTFTVPTDAGDLHIRLDICR